MQCSVVSAGERHKQGEDGLIRIGRMEETAHSVLLVQEQGPDLGAGAEIECQSGHRS